MTTTAKERADRLRATWQWRALRATGGNKSPVGMLLIGILGRDDEVLGPCITDLWGRSGFGPPRLASYGHPRWGGEITGSGIVVVTMLARDNKWYRGQALCMVDKMTERLRWLCDDLKLTDDERRQLFEKTRQWIRRDHRAKSSLSEDDLMRHHGRRN